MTLKTFSWQILSYTTLEPNQRLLLVEHPYLLKGVKKSDSLGDTENTIIIGGFNQRWERTVFWSTDKTQGWLRVAFCTNSLQWKEHGDL